MPDFSIKDNKVIPIIVLVLIGLSIYAFNKMSKIPALSEEIVSGEEHFLENPVKRYVVVDIDGAVNKRGVYRINYGSRLIDVIKFAGGLGRNADISEINLAEILKDGQKVKIPYLNNESSLPVDNPHGNHKVISINNAQENLLDTLPGIGPSMAKKIIEYRINNGPFKQIEELKNVQGIGEGKFEKLKKMISL